VNKLLLSAYNLKWNPFAPNVPLEGLWKNASLVNFCQRLEHLSQEGGFALVTGEPGMGKSVALRLLQAHLNQQRDLKVAVLTRPQASLADFYRELGEVFGVQLSPHNRWAGTKVLRERWQAHLDASLFRPVLLLDEAQEMLPTVLNELRLLCSSKLDSHLLLTCVLAGDGRLSERFRSEDLLPLGSRVRVRLGLERASAEQLRQCLLHALTQAGNPRLMTPELMATLCEHALGNLRVLMNMAGDLLAAGLQRELPQLDEKLYLELFAPPFPEGAKAQASARRR
jgi:general secretion pathway protein A